MFTGIIKHLGKIKRADLSSGQLRLAVEGTFTSPEVDDSIAINGCCLTVVEVEKIANSALANRYEVSFDVLPESLAKTNLSALTPEAEVNTEEALRVGDKLGGHLLQGHVDTVATLCQILTEGKSLKCFFKAPPEFLQMIVPKGFVALDGISLTVVDLNSETFSVMLIPHTRKISVAKNWKVGSQVNLEVDIFNKSIYSYLQKLNQH